MHFARGDHYGHDRSNIRYGYVRLGLLAQLDWAQDSLRPCCRVHWQYRLDAGWLMDPTVSGPTLRTNICKSAYYSPPFSRTTAREAAIKGLR